MDLDEAITEALFAVQKAKALQDFSHTIHNLRDRLGTTNLTYHGLSADNLLEKSDVIITTNNPQWPEQYAAREYVNIDPVVNSGRRSGLPVDWEEVDRRSRTAKYYFAELARYDIGTRGVSIPVFAPNGEIGLFSFTTNHLKKNEWLSFRQKHIAHLGHFGQHIHIQALKIAQGSRKSVKLTRQEKTCLQLKADGYDASAIAEKLHLSIHTVRMHLNHAQERLECLSKSEAIQKALKLGVISKKAKLLCLVFFLDFSVEGGLIDNLISLIS
jgi:DNA-binding CsgD family transcriptional regulator